MDTFPRIDRSTRLSYFKYASAALIFGDVAKYCQDLLAQPSAPKSGSQILIEQTALHILYCKPFKEQSPALKLEEELVPLEYKSVHSGLVRLRDKVYAHTDIKGLETANNPTTNNILLEVGKDGKQSFRTTLLHCQPIRIVDVGALVECLRIATINLAKQIGDDAVRGGNFSPGTYKVDLSEGNKPLFTPFTF